MQWQKDMWQKDKQRSTNHHTENKRSSNRIPTKKMLLNTWHPRCYPCCRDTICGQFHNTTLHWRFQREYHFWYIFVVLCDRNDVLSTDSDICIPSLICCAKINLLEQYHIEGDARGKEERRSLFSCKTNQSNFKKSSDSYI